MLQQDLFPKDSNPDPMAWVALIAGVICIIIYVWLVATIAHADEGDPGLCWPCTKTVYQLQVNGVPVSVNDMSEFECEALKEEVEAQTPPFSVVQCVEVWVTRYDTTGPAWSAEPEKGELQ